MALKALQIPLINGARYSWASVIAHFDGWKCEGFSEITFKRSRERSEVRGPHPNPIGKTRGKNTFEASCKMWLPEFHYFTVEKLGGKGYGDKFFDIEIQYSENGSGLDVITYKIIGCTFDEESISNAEGTDATVVECGTLSPLWVGRPGIDDTRNPLGRAA